LPKNLIFNFGYFGINSLKFAKIKAIVGIILSLFGGIISVYFLYFAIYLGSF
jgi:hypothetical protein